MDKKLQKAFNDQIKHEVYSAYLYLAMSAYVETKNLPGFSHWLKVQFKEELGHAMKQFEFLVDRGERVTLQAVPQPPAEFASPLDIFEKVLEHEKKVTGLIHALSNLAREVNDTAAEIFLQWFVTEQVEEEQQACAIVEKLRLAGDKGSTLLYLDKEFGKRGKD